MFKFFLAIGFNFFFFIGTERERVLALDIHCKVLSLEKNSSRSKLRVMPCQVPQNPVYEVESETPCCLYILPLEESRSAEKPDSKPV